MFLTVRNSSSSIVLSSCTATAASIKRDFTNSTRGGSAAVQRATESAKWLLYGAQALADQSGRDRERVLWFLMVVSRWTKWIISGSAQTEQDAGRQRVDSTARQTVNSPVCTDGSPDPGLWWNDLVWSISLSYPVVSCCHDSLDCFFAKGLQLLSFAT